MCQENANFKLRKFASLIDYSHDYSENATLFVKIYNGFVVEAKDAIYLNKHYTSILLTRYSKPVNFPREILHHH